VSGIWCLVFDDAGCEFRVSRCGLRVARQKHKNENSNQEVSAGASGKNDQFLIEKTQFDGKILN